MLLVEQNLGVVRRIARDAVVLDQGRVVHTSDAQELLAQPELVRRLLSVSAAEAHVSTFILLTITGLGLGAMYFLIASGLSLIYGLMGVLNFAHGAFLTVGVVRVVVDVRATCSTACDSTLAALPARRALRARRRRRLRGARRAGADPAAVPAPHRAGARHGRARRSRSSRSSRASGGRTLRPYAVPGWLHETTTVFGAHIPNDRWIEIATAAAVLVLPAAVPAPDALRADHPRRRREPRDGDGARHRRAQGVHARLRARRHRRRARRRAQRRLLHDDRPEPGDEPADLRVHRRRDRRPRLDRRLGDRGGRRRAAAAVRRTTTRRLGSATWLGRSLAARASSCSRARAASRERSPHEHGASLADFAWPLAVFGALAFVPKIGWDIPKLFDGAISSPGTLQLLALCLLFGGLALTYDLLFGFTGLLSFGHALYVAARRRT